MYLLAYCSLDLSENDLLPKIWTNLQTTETQHAASTELTKWFRIKEVVGDAPFQFHKELVDNIRKLMFSLGPAPMSNNAQRGITMLAFVRMSVGQKNQLQKDP